MKLVIHYKRQKQIDLQLLKLSIKLWQRSIKVKFENIYIIGSYSQEDIHNLQKEFPLLGGIIQVNYPGLGYNKNIPKRTKLAYHLVEAYKILKEPFISAHIDVVPIKRLKLEEDFNKEYEIRHKSFKNILNTQLWWEQAEVETAKWFVNKYGVEDLPVFEHHMFYYITPDFMEYFIKYFDEVSIYSNYPCVLTYYNLLELDKSVDEIFQSDLIGTTFQFSKWQLPKDFMKKFKGINLTLPENIKTKKVIKEIKKKLQIR